MVEQFSALCSNHKRKRLMILGLTLLAPTLLLAVALNFTPLADRTEIDVPSTVGITAGLGNSRAALSQNSPSQMLPASNEFDWPLTQVAASVGILLLTLIGLPLGCRLTNLGRI